MTWEGNGVLGRKIVTVGGCLGVRSGRHLDRVSGTSTSPSWRDESHDLPGKRRESLIRNINANRGKWFKHANKVSNAALSEMMAIRADANVK